MKTSLKKILSVTLLIAVSILFSIFLGESILRVFKPQPLYSFEKGLFTASERFGYSLAPNVRKFHNHPEYSYEIRSNSHGFRGAEPGFDAEHRILILGDSFGMGQGVGEGKNLCDLSSSYFSDRNIDLDIFNTSIPGYSGINQLSVLKYYIGNYKPNLVVLLFCWNDIGVKQSLSVQNGYLVNRCGNRITAPVREWLSTNSHLYCLIKRFYYIHFKKRFIKRGKTWSIPESDIDTSLEYFASMRRICDENGAAFTVVILPVEGAFEGNDEFRLSKEALLSKLRSSSIPYRDWILKLPESDKKDLIYRIDYHWTEKGHLYFSKYLIGLISDLLLDSPS